MHMFLLPLFPPDSANAPWHQRSTGGVAAAWRGASSPHFLGEVAWPRRGFDRDAGQVGAIVSPGLASVVIIALPAGRV